MTGRKQTLIHLFVIALLAGLAMGSSFFYGITTGNDFHQHFQFAISIHDSLISGEIYPSFVAAPNYGLGDIALRFYPPLGYYILSLAYIAIGNWYVAAMATFWLVFFVGGAGVYKLAREEFPPPQSLLAAAIYIFVPYHLNEIYNNFLFAEFVATAVLPFCFLYITRICRKGGLASVIGLSISYAFLILSHLPLTVIGSLALFVYACLLLRKEDLWRSLAALTVSVCTGLFISSFYWVRMVREMNWVKHSSTEYFADTFDFGRNFLFKPANWINFQDDVLALWFADLMLAAVIILVIPSVVLLIRKRAETSGFMRAVAALFFLSVFMATPLSGFIWNLLPFLQKVQFPWRWMAIVSITGAILASTGITSMADAMKAGRNFALPLGLGAILVIFVFMAAFIIKQAVYVPAGDFNKQMATVAEEPSYEGWWPVWAKMQALSKKEKVVISGREANVESWLPTERRFTVPPGETGPASVATFYYPHWQASVNDSPVELSPTADGLISVPVPAGRASVRLSFKEPGINRAAFYVSAIGWIIVLFGIILLAAANFKKRDINEL